VDQRGDRLVDDIGAGAQDQDGLDDAGDRLQLAVAVRVLLVGRHIRGTDGEQGDQGSDEVGAGMGGFREDGDRADPDTDEQLQQDERRVRED
jgi:hypothetical protein